MSERSNKEKRLDYLVDEIGGIDEKYIQQALEAGDVAGTKRRSAFVKALLLAAVISVITHFALWAVAGMLTRGGMNKEDSSIDTTNHTNEMYPDYDSSGDGNDNESDGNRFPEDAPGDEDNGDGDIFTFEDLVEELRYHPEISVTKDSAALLAGGKTQIVWSYGDGGYYYFEVTKEDSVDKLVSLLEDDGEPTELAFTVDFCMWIILEDSRVYSPYLNNGWVDTSTGELETYTAEIEVDKELEQLLTEEIWNALQLI